MLHGITACKTQQNQIMLLGVAACELQQLFPQGSEAYRAPARHHGLLLLTLQLMYKQPIA